MKRLNTTHTASQQNQIVLLFAYIVRDNTVNKKKKTNFDKAQSLHNRPVKHLIITSFQRT